MPRPRKAEQQWVSHIVSQQGEAQALSKKVREKHFSELTTLMLTNNLDQNPLLVKEKIETLGLGLARMEQAIRDIGLALEECPLDGMKDILARIGVGR